MRSKFTATLVGYQEVKLQANFISIIVRESIAREKYMSVGAFKRLKLHGECECFIYDRLINQLLESATKIILLI